MTKRTKIDLSDNRQVSKTQNSVLKLPGVTEFGDIQENLESGPDLNTVTVLVPETQNVTSTFTGNTDTGVYTYSFGIADMAEGEHLIEHFTLENKEGDIQYIGPVWVGKDPVLVNGVEVFTRYEGIKYDLTLAEINDLGNGDVSGSTISTYEKLEADALDYNGDFVWVTVHGTTKTKNLIIQNVGVGPSTIDLGLDADGNAVNVASDERLKENVEPIKGALEKVLGLEGVMYNWKDRKAGTDAVRIGFIAQDVQKIVPELVHEISGSDYLGVYYNNAVPLIIEAIKELVNGDTSTTTTVKEINTEVIYSEDNAIELNYGGTHETANNGGIIIKQGVSDEPNADSKLLVDEQGDWRFEPGIHVPYYTPLSSEDPAGNVGNMVRDENYFYIKTMEGWKRTGLEKF